MKISSILSSRYWVILPTTFIGSLIAFIAIMLIFGPLDTIAENHIDVRVHDVQPACVKITPLNQKDNSVRVNIVCPGLLQHPNRKSLEEELAVELSYQKYILEYGHRDGKFAGSGMLSTFIPYFSADWRIEKIIGDMPVVFTGTVQGDGVFIIANILPSIVALSFLLSVFVLFVFFCLKFLHILHILRHQKPT